MSNRRVVFAFTLAFCGAIASATAVAASDGPPPVLNPKTYTSPSGAYKLDVDPSNMHGQGGGTYRLTRHGEEVWSGQRALTLWECTVTDDGAAAGYAYSQGPDGGPVSKAGDTNFGSFHVVIFERDGKLRLNDLIKRRYNPALHSPPDPIAKGMFVNPQADRFVVRIRGSYDADSLETWWGYQLSTGKRLAKMQPTRPPEAKVGDVTAARTIPGTPLTLLQWWPKEDSYSGEFSIADAEGKPVWTLVVRGDYEVTDATGARTQVLWSLLDGGAVLSVGEGPTFDLRFVREKKRVTFAVEPDPGSRKGWKVSEVRRTDYSEPPSVDPFADIPTIELKHLGSIALGARDAERPAVRGVRDFDFDEQGRIGFLREDPRGSACFVLVEPNGNVVCELPVENDPDNAHPSFLSAWVLGERWVVTSYRDGKERGWWVDTDKPGAQPIQGFDCPAARQLVGTRDGGFIALTHGNYSEGGIIAFDREGKRRWHGGREHSGQDLINSSEHVAVTTDGRVAVTSSTDKAIQLLDRAGKYLDTIDLKKSFGQRPNYPTEIAADLNGGLIVEDSAGTPPIWRLKANGKLAAKLEPKYADGRQFPLLCGVKAGPDGRLWTCDGEALLRLKEDGVADLVLGPKPDAEELGEVSGLAVDQEGRFYAVSTRTANTYVLDREGRPLRVLRPLPTDFPTNLRDMQIAVAGNGDVLLSPYLPTLSGTQYLRFGADGRRIGFEKLGREDIDDAESCFKPGTQERWVRGYHEIYLVGADGKVRRRIERRPNRTWLDSIECFGAAPSGELAASVSDHESPTRNVHPTINLYTKDGEPVRTIPLPDTSFTYRLAYDGRLVVVSLFSKLLFVSADGSSIRRYTPPAEQAQRRAWQPFFSPDGKEVWLFPNGGRAVERFERPDIAGGGAVGTVEPTAPATASPPAK